MGSGKDFGVNIDAFWTKIICFSTYPSIKAPYILHFFNYTEDTVNALKL